MSKGVLIFANNNGAINYFEIAMLNASLISKHMKVPVSVVTDTGTDDYHRTIYGDLVDKLFDKIIHCDAEENQSRTFRNTQYWSVEAPWKNTTRPRAYDLSPYDETIMIDADYLIGSDELNLLWGGEEDYIISKNAKLLNGDDLNLSDKRLSPTGIDMYWATMVYWKKGKGAKILFDLVDHVREHYVEYQGIYNFPGKIYRNDYAFSIAIHILNGWTSHDNSIAPTILSSFDGDECIEIGDGFRMLVNDTEATYLYYPVGVRGINLHIMNKLSLCNLIPAYLEKLK